MSQDTLVQLLQPMITQNADFAPYWGLLGLKGLDFVTGVMRAIAAKDVQPAKLMRTPGAVLVITGAVALCLCLNAISPMFAPVVAVILAIMGGAEAASIVQNVHDWYVVRGLTPPEALKKVADTLKTFQPGAGIIATPPAQSGHDLPQGG